MSGLDIYDEFEITGDGITQDWDFGAPVQQIAGIKLAPANQPGDSMDIGKWEPLPRGVHIRYALADGETVTVYFYRA